MDGQPSKKKSTFNRFFFRGLGIVLPTVLTIWVIVLAYNFVSSRIATPINDGIKYLWVEYVPWPAVTEQKMQDHLETVVQADPAKRRAYNNALNPRDWLRHDTHRAEVNLFWSRYAIGLDLIGLVVAVVLIYIAGALLGSFIGKRLLSRGEELIDRVPLIRRVYPAVKQITDFFFNDQKTQVQFSRVVAVEYPRKGLWSVGLVTGDTMQKIQDNAGVECFTVFVPSSPTPFTGYVITVPVTDTIDLPITIEEALKFAVSGGVLVPPSQQIARHLARPEEDGPGAMI